MILTTPAERTVYNHWWNRWLGGQEFWITHSTSCSWISLIINNYLHAEKVDVKKVSTYLVFALLVSDFSLVHQVLAFSFSFQETAGTPIDHWGPQSDGLTCPEHYDTAEEDLKRNQRHLIKTTDIIKVLCEWDHMLSMFTCVWYSVFSAIPHRQT